ncbi:hypothetical protein QYM36_015345 [Artemia franciscana]|uniref:Uncharacterized protein n=1 Tax=Artemia franciscana TaxID=6661 RepID=A0AA88KX98_ARTSF|nr:hypothetical protein QYM36_015345 [Artemia franciscana]
MEMILSSSSDEEDTDNSDDDTLLKVAKLTSGTGEAQASAVYSAIEDWGITENILAMCFDKTSSNTGQMTGACVLLEQKIDPDTWAEQEDYIHAAEMVLSISVVDDLAKRG